MTNNPKIKDYLKYATFIRRKIHSIAETAWQEKQTLEFLSEHAKNLNCQVFCGEHCLALYFNFGNQQTVALRAELDALPLQEKTELPFCAKNGNMHACGHDGHIAIAMTVAKYLSDHVESGFDVGLKKNLLVVFQPAEEAQGGAEYLLSQEFLANVDFDCGFALHLFPNRAKGRFFSRSDVVLSGSKEVQVSFLGNAKHIAVSDRQGDALKGGAEFLANNFCESKEGFLRFCKGQGGVANNVSCQKFTLFGSMRFFDESYAEKMTQSTQRHIEKVCKKYGLTYEWQESKGIPPVFTNKEILRKIRKRRRVFDSGRLFICDDFGLFGLKMPIAYFLLGTGDGAGLHSEYFDFDESLLITGADFCLDFLKTR